MNVIRAKNQNILNNERGIAALGMAVFTILVVSAVAITLPRYLIESSRATKDYRRQTQYQWILTQVGQIAYGAWQTGEKFVPLGGCPAQTTLRNVDGESFCFPDNGNCVTHPQISVPVCINFAGLIAKNDPETHETELTLQAYFDENLAERISRVALNSSFKIYDAIAEATDVIPNAHAFDDAFGRPPIPGGGAINTTVTVPNCPGDASCVACNAANIHCIRLRICDPHRTGGCPNPEDFFYQRIAIYE